MIEQDKQPGYREEGPVYADSKADTKLTNRQIRALYRLDGLDTVIDKVGWKSDLAHLHHVCKIYQHNIDFDDRMGLFAVTDIMNTFAYIPFVGGNKFIKLYRKHRKSKNLPLSDIIIISKNEWSNPEVCNNNPNSYVIRPNGFNYGWHVKSRYIDDFVINSYEDCTNAYVIKNYRDDVGPLIFIKENGVFVFAPRICECLPSPQELELNHDGEEI